MIAKMAISKVESITKLNNRISGIRYKHYLSNNKTMEAIIGDINENGYNISGWCFLVKGC
jgi:hypothetical protein